MSLFGNRRAKPIQVASGHSQFTHVMSIPGHVVVANESYEEKAKQLFETLAQHGARIPVGVINTTLAKAGSGGLIVSGSLEHPYPKT
jgi:hypothetical protein